MEYLKINTLWNRDGYDYAERLARGEKPPKSTGKIIIGQYSNPIFGNIKKWSVTEKIDGTNIRIVYTDHKVVIKGRTDDASIPTRLLEYLQDTFSPKVMQERFPEAPVILFGEGYGPKIQKGIPYEESEGFALFDVVIDGWWLTRDNVMDVADQLGIKTAPHIVASDGTLLWTEEDIVAYVKLCPRSQFAKNHRMIEGIVARAEPMVMTRDQKPVMFKLKCRDFMEKTK